MSRYLAEDRERYIRELRDEAGHVKELIGVYKKRRPIVIEFSGSPKSGKTSSINSLMQFFKRNDFKVKVLRESAGECPVRDKHSPLFNLWTACDSIKSLVGVLESERAQYDVIILDRGIFDSMCWFQWLFNSGKMDCKMKTVLDQFLSMEELLAYIDIVFVYTVRPEVSIEREYASLLTDIPGSIMNKEILTAYLAAVNQTVLEVENKGLFRKIQKIDTSNKSQNEVSKEVTSAALKILKELLEERIGFVESVKKVKRIFEMSSDIEYNQFKALWKGDLEVQFAQRSILEKSKDKVQIIPIAVFKEKETGEVLIVKKPPKATKSDSVERDKILPYVGGHIRQEDKNGENATDFLEICKTALKREVREELGVSIALDNVIPDLIYVPDGSRSELHIAVCFLVMEKKSTMKVHVNTAELVSNKGRGKSGTFVEPEIIAKECNSWGQIILRKYFRITPDMDQLSLFEKRQ